MQRLSMLASALVLLLCGGLRASGQSFNYPTSTFVQPYLPAGWSASQWNTEMAALKAAGYNSIILQFTAYATTAPGETPSYTVYYPSTTLESWGFTYDGVDVVGNTFKYAAANGLKVYIGLNFDDSWFNPPTDTDSQANASWLDTEMNFGDQIVSDIVAGYLSSSSPVNYTSSFAGWYWPWEMDNYNLGLTNGQLANDAAALKHSCYYCKLGMPGYPVMISPFMAPWASTPSQYATMLNSVFTQAAGTPSSTGYGSGDIFAPQDSCAIQDSSSLGVPVSQLGTWFSALQGSIPSGSGINFWSNAETFYQDLNGGLHTATLSRIISQLQAEAPYVSNTVAFSYIHYQSPLADWLSGLGSQAGNYQNLYVYYKTHGTNPDSAPTTPTGLTGTRNSGGSVTLKWTASTDSYAVCGYYISRSDSSHPKAQIWNQAIPYEAAITTKYKDTTAVSGTTYTYYVQAYNLYGLTSGTATVVVH